MGKAWLASRWSAPLLLLSVATVFGALALWVSGFEPLAWWQAHEQTAAANAVPLRAAPSGPISIVQPTPLGTDSSVSRTPLALQLTATRLGRNSREGYADIGVNVLSPQTYRAGAILANGARLEEIYADSVVLVRDNLKTRLYVQGHTPPAGGPSPAASLVTVGGRAPAQAAGPNSSDTLSEVMRVAPVFEGDRLRGLELNPSAHSDIFARLGLKPGDRVTAIDGVALKSAEEAIAELRRLSEGASMNLTIERGGETQVLSLDGSWIRAEGTRADPS